LSGDGGYIGAVLVPFLSEARLRGYDAVVCLAALSNDPLGDLNPAATFSVNLDGTMRLAAKAKEAGVPRFLFWRSGSWPSLPTTTSAPPTCGSRPRTAHRGDCASTSS